MKKLSDKSKQFDSWTKANSKQSTYDFEIKKKVKQMHKKYEQSNNKLTATRNRRIEVDTSFGGGVADSIL
jgi:hypothetical protein